MFTNRCSTKTKTLRDVVAFCLCLMLPLHAAAAPQDNGSQENTLGKQYLNNLFSDQKTIWTSPARIRGDHLLWLIPFAATAGGLFATDSNVVKQLSVSPSTISHNHTLANGGAALMVGGGAAFYLYGRFSHNDHAREAGVLSS